MCLRVVICQIKIYHNLDLNFKTTFEFHSTNKEFTYDFAFVILLVVTVESVEESDLIASIRMPSVRL